MTSITGNKIVYSLWLMVYKKRKSFTLMEMLVVLAVIVLIIGVSIPFFASFTKGAKLKTAAKDITAVLNTARSAAITYRKNYSVFFNTSSLPHAYYIIDEDGNLYGKKYYLPSSIGFERPHHSSPTTFPDNKATFSTTGGLATSTSSVWIADKKGDLRRITVSNTTGRVKIDQEP